MSAISLGNTKYMNNRKPVQVPLYIVILFIICLVSLTGSGIANYQNLQILKKNNEWMDRAWNVKNRLRKINILVTGLENSLRGYFLSNNPEYLDPWKAAPDRLAIEFAGLEQLMQNNPAQMNNFLELRSLYNLKMKEFEDCISLVDSGQQTTGMNRGAAITNEIRRLDGILQNQESESITKQQNEFFSEYNEAMWSCTIINSVAVLTLILFYRLICMSFAKQNMVEDQLKATNDNLESTVQLRTRQLSVLSRHLLCVAEDEKAKLARELHDELGASLTAISMDISTVREQLAGKEPELAQHLHRAKQTLLETINLKRRIMENLRPSMLDSLGLAASIRHHCAEISRINGMNFKVNITEDFDNIDPAWAIALFRITQEALTNVIKYANASHAQINLKRQANGLWLQIVDDGIGISRAALDKPKSHGLSGMRERALLLGGIFSVKRGINNQGCSIEVFLPFASQADSTTFQV